MTSPGSAYSQPQPQEPERRPESSTAPESGDGAADPPGKSQSGGAVGPPPPPGYPVQLYRPRSGEPQPQPGGGPQASVPAGHPAPGTAGHLTAGPAGSPAAGSTQQWAVVPNDEQRMPRRFTQFTRSPLGLVLGLAGVAVGAAFTYLLSVTADTAGGATVIVDPGRTLVLVRNLWQPESFPTWLGPLVVLAPFLPLIQLVVVPLLCLPAARAVGPGLTSRARLAWTVFFFLVTAAGVVATVVTGPGHPLFLLHWVGSALVVIALALPHRPD